MLLKKYFMMIGRKRLKEEEKKVDRKRWKEEERERERDGISTLWSRCDDEWHLCEIKQ